MVGGKWQAILVLRFKGAQYQDLNKTSVIGRTPVLVAALRPANTSRGATRINAQDV